MFRVKNARILSYVGILLSTLTIVGCSKGSLQYEYGEFDTDRAVFEMNRATGNDVETTRAIHRISERSGKTFNWTQFWQEVNPTVADTTSYNQNKLMELGKRDCKESAFQAYAKFALETQKDSGIRQVVGDSRICEDTPMGEENISEYLVFLREKIEDATHANKDAVLKETHPDYHRYIANLVVVEDDLRNEEIKKAKEDALDKIKQEKPEGAYVTLDDLDFSKIPQKMDWKEHFDLIPSHQWLDVAERSLYGSHLKGRAFAKLADLHFDCYSYKDTPVTFLKEAFTKRLIGEEKKFDENSFALLINYLDVNKVAHLLKYIPDAELNDKENTSPLQLGNMFWSLASRLYRESIGEQTNSSLEDVSSIKFLSAREDIKKFQKRLKKRGAYAMLAIDMELINGMRTEEEDTKEVQEVDVIEQARVIQPFLMQPSLRGFNMVQGESRQTIGLCELDENLNPFPERDDVRNRKHRKVDTDEMVKAFGNFY